MTYTQAKLEAPPEPLTGEQLAARWQQSFPESRGPGTEHESGYVDYSQPAGNVRVGEIPSLLPPAQRDRERAECERKAAVWAGIEKDAADALRKRLEEARA